MSAALIANLSLVKTFFGQENPEGKLRMSAENLDHPSACVWFSISLNPSRYFSFHPRSLGEPLHFLTY